MKSICKFVFVILAVIIVFSCNKENDVVFKAHFSVVENKFGPLQLFVNGAYKGILPPTSKTYECQTEGKDSLTLSFDLPSGEYTFETKDSLGNVLQKSINTYKENASSGSTKQGGVRSTTRGNCIMIELTPIRFTNNMGD